MPKQDFTASEPLLARPVAFHRCFIPVTTNCPIGALYLSQAWYWRDKGKDPDGWVYKSHIEFTKETGLTKFQQSRARKSLDSKSWWEEKVKRVGTVPTFHYRIDRDGLMAEVYAMHQLSESKETELSESKETELSESKETELSIYKDSEITPIEYKAENTHTLERGELGKSADADVCVDAYLDVEIVEPEMEPEQSTSPAQPDSNNSSLAVSAISREGELSGGCSIIPDKSMATANFDNRMRYALTPARIAETASKILGMFNAAKPLYWKSLGVIQKPLKEHCEKYIKDYLREGKDTDEAVGLFEDDFKYSLIGLKTSKFHTSKDFENGNIYFLLEKDRVYRFAGTGRSLNPTEQAIVADKLIGDMTAKVIRDFHNGKVLSDTDMYFRRNSYRKLLKKQDPDAPTIEYLQENFPELLTELTENK